MRACARCPPPGGPDVAALLAVVLVAALLVALEAGVVAAEDSPCVSPADHLGRQRRTTASLGTPATPEPADGHVSTEKHWTTAVVSDTPPTPDVSPEAAPAVPAVRDPPSPLTPPSAPTAPAIEVAVEPAPGPETVQRSAPGEAGGQVAAEPEFTAPTAGDAEAPLGVDDVVVDVETNNSLKDETEPPRRTTSAAARTPAGTRAPPPAVAKLQQERARRLERLQREMVERKRRARLRATTAGPLEDADLGEDDVDDGVREEPVADTRRHHDHGDKRQGRHPAGRQPAARTGGKHPEDAVSDEDAVGNKDRGGSPHHKKARPEHDRRGSHGSGKRARHQDPDDDDARSVEDNSLSDESWESGTGAATDASVSGEWGGLVCPTTEEVSIFSRQCQSDRDCKSVGEQCCKDRLGLRRCVLGVAPAMPDIPHEPFFGVIARVCPSPVDTYVEPWTITNCTTDDDCWPRVCCVDGPYAYCRTPQLEWEKLPGQRFVAPLRLLMSYLQCTPPPPPVFDLFPKPCRNTLDCFPNLCCQERGRKVCRPPKRSLLALMATLGQVRSCYS
ncbi:hypothetical protein ONE63_001532 [Megalurothrips usitatus]|uniref:WAP domain-containing protein n=1 Tax=Megalurothrips usitatus TaxID=439358 RepID=A0AAV7XGK7_9NEOP|nr:hypothetical protein ONE63_001532 [Megalurothrips usitatus]